MQDDKSKVNVTEEKVTLEKNNFTMRQFACLDKSAGDIKDYFNLSGFDYKGGIIAHAFAGKDGQGVTFVTVPFLAQVPENAATMMLDQIRKDMMAAYGRNEKGRKL